MSILFHVASPTHIHFSGQNHPCVIGREGFVPEAEKYEGDHKTPQGIYALRHVFYRADRVKPPQTKLPTTPITPKMGWCDAPQHSAYNQLVSLPFVDSHELLWRQDHCYDLIVTLSHNTQPAVPGKGSAIFLHLPHDDGRNTAGCVAMSYSLLSQIIEQAEATHLIQFGEVTR